MTQLYLSIPEQFMFTSEQEDKRQIRRECVSTGCINVCSLIHCLVRTETFSGKTGLYLFHFNS